MLARWELKTTGDEVEIRYHNLRTGQMLLSGNDSLGSGLTAFMAEEGGGGTELVFLDGHFQGYIMPAVDDRTPEPDWSLDIPAILGKDASA
jgi:hypothetical protein